nr:hemagglutinin repeat-containing protein [Pseudomonas sp. MWU16-30317]
MSISAGRDINNVGSALQSGRDLTLTAGRDVNIAATQVTNSQVLNSKHTSSDITQLGSTVDAGRDVAVQGGRDINVVASQVAAKGAVAMTATENLTVSSAADEAHKYDKNKHTKTQKDDVTQVMSGITAGGAIDLTAGEDMTLVSSRVTAGQDASLVAGGTLNVLAAQDSHYSLYDYKKKGSFGQKKTKHDESTRVTNIGSEISADGDVSLLSGGDQRYQVAKLDSGKDLLITSGGSLAFEGVKDQRQETHTKSNSSLAWNSSKGKGSTDETLRQSELTAKGTVAINAVNGLKIDITKVNKATVSQAIDSMVAADPKLAWLKDAEKRGDIDWRQVAEIHQRFKYENSSLGAAAQLVIAIALAAVTGGAAAGLVGATSGTFAAGFANAVALAVETKAATSFIGNEGRRLRTQPVAQA